MNIQFYQNEEYKLILKSSTSFSYLCSFDCTISNQTVTISKVIDKSVVDLSNLYNEHPKFQHNITLLYKSKHILLDAIQTILLNADPSETETKDFIQSIYNNETLVKTLTKQQLLKEL